MDVVQKYAIDISLHSSCAKDDIVNVPYSERAIIIVGIRCGGFEEKSDSLRASLREVDCAPVPLFLVLSIEIKMRRDGQVRIKSVDKTNSADLATDINFVIYAGKAIFSLAGF